MNENVALINMDAFLHDESMFAQSVRYLLAKTCIVRSKDESSRKLYRFCIRPENFNKVNEYLGVIGFRAVSDNDGVICMEECSDVVECRTGHRNLSTVSTELIKLIAWLYFDREKSSASDVIRLTISDIWDAIDKFGLTYLKSKLNANKLKNCFAELSAYNLIQIKGIFGQDDYRIEALSSLKKFFSSEKLNSVYGGSMQENAPESESDNSSQEDEILRNQISVDDLLEDAQDDLIDEMTDSNESDDTGMEEDEDDEV